MPIIGHRIIDPPLYALPEIQAVLDQLVGAGNHANGLRPVNPFLGETEEPYHKETDNFIVKFPGEKPWVAPSGGHIEGYNGTKGGWFGGCAPPLCLSTARTATLRPALPALPCRSLALTAALAADMMGAITYLEDVDPEGGAFFFWPRSHLAMHRYMCAHPERIVDGCSSDPWRRDDEGNLVGDSHNAWNTEILNDVCRAATASSRASGPRKPATS